MAYRGWCGWALDSTMWKYLFINVSDINRNVIKIVTVFQFLYLYSHHSQFLHIPQSTYDNCFTRIAQQQQTENIRVWCKWFARNQEQNCVQFVICNCNFNVEFQFCMCAIRSMKLMLHIVSELCIWHNWAPIRAIPSVQFLCQNRNNTSRMIRLSDSIVCRSDENVSVEDCQTRFF